MNRRKHDQDESGVLPLPFRILVVDDSWDDQFLIRNVLSRVIRNSDHLAFRSHGDLLLRTLNALGYDVLILDQRLPKGDNGIELLQQVRQQMESPPQIMMVVGLPSHKLSEEALAAGAFLVLDKDTLTPKVMRKAQHHSRDLGGRSVTLARRIMGLSVSSLRP